MRDVAVLRPHNPVAFVVVAVGQRNPGGDVRVLQDFFRFALKDVSGGGVDVVDIGQNELQRTAFRTEHQVDVLDVALKCVVHLFLRQKHQADHADSKRQQRQAQRRLQRLGPEVARGLVEQTQFHGA